MFARRRVIAAAAILALVTAGGASASPPLAATPGVGTTSSGAVPGLVPFGPGQHLLVAVPGPAPTFGQCASAWNATAPAATRQWITARHLTGVYIAVEEQGNRSGTRFGPICNVAFYLGHGQMLGIYAPWKDSTTPLWQGGIQTIPPMALPAFVGSLDGVAGPDGTVRCRTRCAESIKPPPSIP